MSPYTNVTNGPSVRKAVTAINLMSGTTAERAKELGMTEGTINKWRKEAKTSLGDRQLVGNMRRIIVTLLCDQAPVPA